VKKEMSRQKAYRIWGIHVVEEVLRESPEMVEKIFLDKNYYSAEVKKLIQQAKEIGIPIVQGRFSEKVGAQMAVIRFGSLDDIDPNTDYLGLVLDGITDENNIGSIFRTAAAFGVNFVLVPKRRFGSISPVVARVSQGGVYKVKVIKVNLEPALHHLKDRGYWVYATHVSENAQSIYNVSFDKHSILVMGREDKGVSKTLLKLSDEKIYIPMVGMQSLNVGVATGIVLYEYRRQWQP